MNLSDLLPFAQGGPFLALLAYMIWDKTAERQVAKDRIETDKEIARAMTVLAAKIDGLSRHV